MIVHGANQWESAFKQNCCWVALLDNPCRQPSPKSARDILHLSSVRVQSQGQWWDE